MSLLAAHASRVTFVESTFIRKVDRRRLLGSQLVVDLARDGQPLVASWEPTLLG